MRGASRSATRGAIGGATRGAARAAGRRAAGLLVLLTACAHYPVNPPLAPPYDPAAGYRFTALTPPEDAPGDDGVFVVLTFSGGGTRAAAFSYGAMQALRETGLGDERSLLDEVDVVSSVSGGSFAAAYYGLRGPEAFFRDFPDAVLYRRIERDLAWKLVSPRTWVRLLSPDFARSDLADEYYDGAIFGGARYADLPRRRPFVVLNATDVSLGAQLSFTQDHFDRLCSDLDGVKVSRAVTASSAFPLAFSPLTFDNRAKASCGYTTPIWVELAEQDFDVAPSRWALARTWRSYEDAARRPYIHLSDGGIADNIGLRVVTTGLEGDDPLGIFARASRGEIRHLVVIAVDAKPRADPEADLSPKPPGLVDVLNAAATRPMENYSTETIERIRLWFAEWDRADRTFRAIRARCDARDDEAARADCRAAMRVTDADRPPHPELTFVHVRFEAIPDDEARARLEKVPTRLQLPREQVDELVDWGRRLLVESPRYVALVDRLRAGD